MADLDQGGQTLQWTRIWLGPSLGWVVAPVQPKRIITAAGDVTVIPGDYVILLNKTVGAITNVNLPDVALWVKQTFYSVYSVGERALWIKDLKGDAAANNITVVPFGTQKIDALAQNFTIVQNRMLLRLYPMDDLTGWFSG